ncbi:peptidase inhibitor family I36 protein [Streptomyces sp. P9(2023)]|uniref:peptidase inhibitor family I36 protein n=1 Tax=Streptomyces sp. P9(2023) TaxID=3064394 RepID=UPI0028F43DB4|nr:peptidase inhibitor family I36 protein [Streptomyces sp. P9(2023)]MDT9687197.1 peptidase inhibitor family I36 protein [Streptomyces sp. P9(2023)]
MIQQETFRSSALGKAVIALMMALLALVATTSAAGATTGPGGGSARTDFSAQATAAGLSNSQAKSLQGRVDTYLAKTPGTQVAANEIALAGGGTLLLTLPGEKQARELGAENASRAAAAGCPYTYVCAYKGENFTGDELRLYTCNYAVPIYWSGTGSWINNQRSTLYAKFYDVNGYLGWTSPGGYSEDRHAPWGWVYWLSPC